MMSRLALATFLFTGAAGQESTLADVLGRAGEYVRRFIAEFSNVVAEETYVQDAAGNLPVVLPGRRGLVAPAPPSRHRELKADYLLVRVGPSDWLPFRDVYEVDGQAIRDREGRLARLFLQSSAAALDQAAEITRESARYNLGAMQRTVNTPILPLVFLQPDMQPHFRFTRGKADASSAGRLWVVEFKETARPTFVRGLRNSDVPASGRYWIDPASGRVEKCEIALETPGVRARLVTSFRRDERFQIDVPFEMREQYDLDRGQVTAVASYSRFRRFDVTADEAFHPVASPLPPSTVVDARSGLTLVEIQPGRFTMGSAASEPGHRDDETPHDATLNHSFFLGQHEVTVQEWRAVMGAAPPRPERPADGHEGAADCGPRCPVVGVSFADVQDFLAALNRQTDRRVAYRLPTEAEWEYACRAGAETPFSTGETLTTTAANFDGRRPYAGGAAGLFRARVTRAGGFPANAWGLADMHGNAAEWVADWYGPYPHEDVIDPPGPAGGTERVVRGGSWQSDAAAVRCAARSRENPARRDATIGFRVAADPLPPTEAAPGRR